MEVKVLVTIDLSEGTKKFILGLAQASAGDDFSQAEKAVKSKPAEDVTAEEEPEAKTRTRTRVVKEEVAEEEPEVKTRTRTRAAKEEPAEEPPVKTRSRKTRSRKTAKEEGPAFEDLDDDGKLEAIKTEVTRHTKKGKTKDIRDLLGVFDASRASELDPKDYVEFYEVIKRYSAGESVDDIFPEQD